MDIMGALGASPITGGLLSLYNSYNTSKNKTAGKYKQDLDAATDANTSRLGQLADYYKQQQASAVANYAPLKQLYGQYYGTQGVAAPQLPPRVPPGGGGVR